MFGEDSKHELILRILDGLYKLHIYCGIDYTSFSLTAINIVRERLK